LAKETTLIPARDHPNHDELAAFLWGQLGGADQEAVEKHVAGCAACCRILGEVPEGRLLEQVRCGCNPQAAAANAIRDHSLPPELRDHPRYKIGRFLGSGGMGFVYQAEHRYMERPVALKIIHRDLIWHAQAVERFRREVRAAARLTHANLVTAYDAEEAGGAHFMVMEFVDGLPLNRLVEKRGPLGVAFACNYARQAARGLQHAFENGMVHRDIKPHNLMLTRKGRIKILDFGLAILVGGERIGAEDTDLRLPSRSGRSCLTMPGEIVGTPAFLAPEQARNPRGVDTRADIYSLGCTLYYLLAAQDPFAEGTTRTKLFSHSYRQPPPLSALRSDLPAELLAVIGKMTAKNPLERYQTPAEVVRALAPFAGRVASARQAKKAGSEAVARPSTRPPAVEAPATAAPASPSATAADFPTRCPYCSHGLRVPNRALAASVLCPKCRSYFTAAPEEDATKKTHQPVL
jgi:serine/threonine protein kinase